LVDVALSSPSERGLPFSVWSVSKLAEYCRRRNLPPPGPTSGFVVCCAAKDCFPPGISGEGHRPSYFSRLNHN
jgi:hypothetical protein